MRQSVPRSKSVPDRRRVAGEQQERGVLKRFRERRQARKQRALDNSHREHEGGSMRGGRRQDGLKEGVPGPSDQFGGV